VTGEPAAGARFEIACPHCRQVFVADLIDGPASRYRGFKCPHCRLFVPYERADEPDALDHGGSR
jgi:hypothetical protein